jgi:hypothetical protein
LSLKTEKKNTTYEVSHMLGISLGSVQIMLKDDLNMGQMVTKVMPNSCPTCCVRSRRTIMSILATTVRTGLKETQK